MEGAWFQKTGSLVSFSEQQFVDCDFNNKGCGGGYMEGAFDYAKVHAIAQTRNYPYTGRNDACRHDSVPTLANVLQYVEVTPRSPSALQLAVKENGPISVYVTAGQSFTYYSSGIISTRCPAREDHAITIVGYGNDGTREYWIGKNSWG